MIGLNFDKFFDLLTMGCVFVYSIDNDKNITFFFEDGNYAKLDHDEVKYILEHASQISEDLKKIEDLYRSI